MNTQLEFTLYYRRVNNYGKDIEDPVMQQFGAFLAEKQNWGKRKPGEKIDEQIMQLMYLDEISKATTKNALISDFWLPDIQVGGGRDKAGTSEGFFFAAKGGHNAESHNHNDLGSCVLYFNGKPCLIDLGRETYTAHTFSSRRYEIWTMQSQYHNIPRINGFDQLAGRDYKAKNTEFKYNNRQIMFSTDITDAYPTEAGIKKWERSYRLDRGKRFVIKDVYQFNRIPDDATSLNFITYCKVSQNSPGSLLLQGECFALEMKYDSKTLVPEVEFIEVTDNGLKRYWPDGVTRVVFMLKDPKIKGENSITVVKK